MSTPSSKKKTPSTATDGQPDDSFVLSVAGAGLSEAREAPFYWSSGNEIGLSEVRILRFNFSIIPNKPAD